MRQPPETYFGKKGSAEEREFLMRWVDVVEWV